MPNRAQVALENVVMSYGPNIPPAVDNVSLEVEPGELLTLLGPSGSGKSSLLNIIAGFLSPSAGRVLIGGTDVTDVPPHKRDIGMVFQNYALFPHMTIAANVEFPLRQRKIAKAERTRRVRDALELVHLADKSNRKPDQLSGGQRQRVALARAIVFEPELLLMDEPLGALDKALRTELQEEIRRLHRVVGRTLVFVTHDQEEALALSDRIAVIKDGKIDQVGRTEEIYQRPDTLFSAQFLGESTVLHGHRDPGSDIVMTDAGKVRLADHVPDRYGAVSVMIRPEHAWLRPHAATGAQGASPSDETLNLGEMDARDYADIPADVDAVPAVVSDVVYQGGTRKVHVSIGAHTTGIVVENTAVTDTVTTGSRVLLMWRVADAWLV